MRHCYEPDREFDPNSDSIICNTCVHRRKGITCDAFPDGIPMYILRNGEHFTSVPSDQGITYSPIDDSTRRGGTQ